MLFPKFPSHTLEMLQAPMKYDWWIDKKIHVSSEDWTLLFYGHFIDFSVCLK